MGAKWGTRITSRLTHPLPPAAPRRRIGVSTQRPYVPALGFGQDPLRVVFRRAGLPLDPRALQGSDVEST